MDRFEILRPQFCFCCGSTGFITEPIKIETLALAQLVERPIEIVEYHRHTCICDHCGNPQTADWSPDIVPGQDIGIKLQAFLGWVNNYGHLPYEKQQEFLWELGKIEIGVGTLVTTNERIDAAVNQSVSSLKDWIQQTQPNIHSDETPWVITRRKRMVVDFCFDRLCFVSCRRYPFPCRIRNHPWDELSRCTQF